VEPTVLTELLRCNGVEQSRNRSHRSDVREQLATIDAQVRAGERGETSVAVRAGKELTFKRHGQRLGIVLHEGTVRLTGHPDLRYDYEVVVEVSVVPKPHPVLAALTVMISRPGDDLRRNDVARELATVRTRAVTALAERVDQSGRTSLAMDAPAGDIRAVMKLVNAGPPTVDVREMKAAAKLYREAMRKGKSTGAFVHQEMNRLGYVMSESTARKRVMQARNAGYLPPTTPGRKGWTER
jgi:hypothetical protein